MDDEQKDFYQRLLRLRFQAQQFRNTDFFKQGFHIFAQSTVIKFPRVWQSLFYLLRIRREDICEPETNKLSWKIAKKQLDQNANNLIEKLLEYEPLGPKDDEYTYYTTLNFVEKNIDHYYPEDVDTYSCSILARLMRWVLTAVKLRRADIVRRKAHQKKAKDMREDAINREQHRQERQVKETADAEAKFLDDRKDEIEAAIAYQNRDPSNDDQEDGEKEPVPVMPVFNKEEFTAKWLTDNPPIEIPEPVVDDIDNDWVLPPSEVEYLINSYFGKE